MRTYLDRLKWISNVLEEEAGLRSSRSISHPLHKRLGTAGKGYFKRGKKKVKKKKEKRSNIFEK